MPIIERFAMKSRAIQALLTCATVTSTLFLTANVHAQAVAVKDAWARATVPGQMATGVFMTLTAKDSTQLVGVSTPAADVAEVHEMKVKSLGNVMTMRALPILDLPAGKPVELRPGSYHIMLMDLKAPLALGSNVPMTLLFKDAKGAESRMELKVPVNTSANGAMPAKAHSH